MFKGIWQSSGVSGPIQYMPRYSQEVMRSLFSPAADPWRNMATCFEHSCPSLQFLFWAGFFWRSGQISCESLQKFCIEHPPFTRQIYSHHKEWKSLLIMQSHVCKKRQTAWPQLMLQPQQITGRVQRHLKALANRRAVQDTARKKQEKSLGSNVLFDTAAREVL